MQKLIAGQLRLQNKKTKAARSIIKLIENKYYLNVKLFI